MRPELRQASTRRGTPRTQRTWTRPAPSAQAIPLTTRASSRRRCARESEGTGFGVCVEGAGHLRPARRACMPAKTKTLRRARVVNPRAAPVCGRWIVALNNHARVRFSERSAVYLGRRSAQPHPTSAGARHHTLLTFLPRSLRSAPSAPSRANLRTLSRESAMNPASWLCCTTVKTGRAEGKACQAPNPTP